MLRRLEKVRALESTMKGEVADLFRHSLELIGQTMRPILKTLRSDFPPK